MASLDVNKILALLCLATAVIIAVASIINLLSGGFNNIVVSIYVFVVCLVVFTIDISMPVACAQYFAFIQHYWGRGLIYILLGCLVYGNGEEFSFFAFIWGVAMGFIFLLLAVLAYMENDNVSKDGKMQPLYVPASGSGASSKA